MNKNDLVIGISASGSTPYVIGGLEICKKNKITTGCITCNQKTKIAENSDFPIEVIVGPEYVTGSSRMKAGTAQKMILNMISTTVMIKLGRIHDNKMIDMKLSNNKLYERAVRILKTILDIETETAKKLIKEHKNMVDNLRRGDQVLTQGGIIGKITKVKEGEEIEVELAKDVKVSIIRSTIVNVLSKTEPAKK